MLPYLAHPSRPEKMGRTSIALPGSHSITLGSRGPLGDYTDCLSGWKSYATSGLECLEPRSSVLRTHVRRGQFGNGCLWFGRVINTSLKTGRIHTFASFSWPNTGKSERLIGLRAPLFKQLNLAGIRHCTAQLSDRRRQRYPSPKQ